MTIAFTTKLFAGALALVAAAGLGATGAAAQQPEAYVSGTSTGDYNPCTRAFPCLTFAQAQSRIRAEGAIICLDPGRYFDGVLTITKSLTIDCRAGGVSNSVPGFNINAPGAFVKLLHAGLDGFRSPIPLPLPSPS